MTTKKVISCLGLIAVAIVAMSTVSKAAEPNTKTTISVKGMHCQSCAKKVVTRLKEVPGVGVATADAKKGRAVVAPKRGAKLPSPRRQWEAVEKAGFKPIRLAGPFGVFTSKPKR